MSTIYRTESQPLENSMKKSFQRSVDKNGDGVYSVEMIQKRKKVKSKKMALVKWLGYEIN